MSYDDANPSINGEVLQVKSFTNFKWKDIYEMMGRITDRLEDVANVLQGVIVKMS